VRIRLYAVIASVLAGILIVEQGLSGTASLARMLIEVLGFAVVLHSYVLGSLAVKRDPRLNYFAAAFCIFFSGMWFIGPITYFFLRKKYPYLARCCIQQLAVAMVFWIGASLIDNHLKSPGPVSPGSATPAPAMHQ
jgi:hypothetical protein